MKRPASFAVVLGLLGAMLLARGMSLSAQEPKPTKPPAPAIQILKVESDEVKLPPAFQMALYENLVDEVKKTGKFQHVYRDGERGAANVPDLLTLRSIVRGFKQGSARERQVTTVAGTTSIRVRVEIATRDGHRLLDRDVEGKVRFLGENLRATYNFSKNVARIIHEQLYPATE